MLFVKNSSGRTYQFPNEKIPELKNTVDQVVDKWRYNKRLFEVGRENMEVEPNVMPVIYNWLVRKNALIRNSELAAKMKSLPQYHIRLNNRGFSEEEVLKARCYQFLTGALREIDVMINMHFLNPNLMFIKDLGLEHEGIDIVCKNQNVELFFDVFHPGIGSSFHRNTRKHLNENAIKLIAPRTDFFDKVPLSSYESIIRNIEL